MNNPAQNPVAEITSSTKARGVQPGFAAQRFPAILLLGATFILCVGDAIAGTAVFNVSDPQIDKDGQIKITINGKRYPVAVKVGMNAGNKADAIASALGNAGFTVGHTPGSTSVTLPKLGAKNTISFDVGTTGELNDSIGVTGNVKVASVDFDNSDFSSLDYQGNVARFMSGFSTDRGSLVFSVSAQSLTSTSGVAIAQELYSLMEPEASAYGINLTLKGEDLCATFDPGSTVNGASVFFGTTSTSSGVIGRITTVPEPTSLALLCSGAIGVLGAVLRKRLKKAS